MNGSTVRMYRIDEGYLQIECELPALAIRAVYELETLKDDYWSVSLLNPAPYDDFELIDWELSLREAIAAMKQHWISALRSRQLSTSTFAGSVGEKQSPALDSTSTDVLL